MTTEEKCFALTGSFEGCGYGGLTGNFDGQGWSAGILSWATGQGTLQPLVRAYHDAGAATFQRCCTVPVEGRGTVDLSGDLLTWVGIPVDQAVLWAASRCEPTGEKRPLPHWIAVFKNFGDEPGYQAIQRQHGAFYVGVAQRICQTFGFHSERGFALAFDIAVQDGSVKAEARSAFDANDPGRDASEERRLEVLAHAVANASEYPDDVRARKLTIATGAGIVHGQTYDLAHWPGLTLGPIVA